MTKNKILLIDFDQEFLKFLGRVLSQEGYEIQVAADGLAGFQKFSEYQPDLVIMEAMLPKFHGFELCSRITSHPTKKAPVIIVTGIYKDAVYKTEALRSLGASGFFEKPLNLEALLSKVYELIGKPEVKKHQVKSEEEEDLDKLLKQALASAYTPEHSSDTARATEKTPKRDEIKKTPTTPKDDEIELILKSKLKDLITTSPEKGPARTTHQTATAAPTKKPEPSRQSAGSEVKKTEPAVSQAPGGSLTGKKPFEKEAKTTGFDQTVKAEPKTTQKPEPVRTSSSLSYVFEEETSKPVSPPVNPFKSYTEGNKEKTGKKASAKYIGLAAGALAVIGLVAFLTLGKKKGPEFSPQPVNQTAALQTAGTDQTKELPANENLNKEEDLNKEIEKQMAEYRNQQNRTEKSSDVASAQNTKGGSAARTPARNQPAAIPAAPIIPQETPKIEVNINGGQQVSPPDQLNTATTSQIEETKTRQEEPPVAVNQVKPEEQPVDLGNLKARPGDIVPLSMVEVEPKLIKSVEPVFPEVDRRAGIKGNVMVNVLISEKGDVLEAVIIRGIKGSVALEKEAVSAVKKWKFLPAEKDGVKVKVWKPITIGFGLNK